MPIWKKNFAVDFTSFLCCLGEESHRCLPYFCWSEILQNKISWLLNAFSTVTGVIRRFHLWRTVYRELLNKLINSILTFVLFHCGSHFFPQPEFCTMIVDCCAQQRSYEKFFGLLAQVSFFRKITTHEMTNTAESYCFLLPERESLLWNAPVTMSNERHLFLQACTI